MAKIVFDPDDGHKGHVGRLKNCLKFFSTFGSSAWFCVCGFCCCFVCVGVCVFWSPWFWFWFFKRRLTMADFTQEAKMPIKKTDFCSQ